MLSVKLHQPRMLTVGSQNSASVSQGTSQLQQFNGTGREQRSLGLTRRYVSVWQDFFNARFGIFQVFFFFFNEKNDILSDIKSFFFLPFFFSCLENTSHILFWVRLMQTEPSFFSPLQISRLGCFPRLWLPLHPSRASQASHAYCLCPIFLNGSLQKAPRGSLLPPWTPSKAPAWAKLIQPTALILRQSFIFLFFFTAYFVL